MAYCVLILLGKTIQKLVFAELRVSERQHLKDKFWNFVFYKFIFVFGVLNVQYMDEVLLWWAWFTALGFLSLLSQLCKDRFEYVSDILSADNCWADPVRDPNFIKHFPGCSKFFLRQQVFSIPLNQSLGILLLGKDIDRIFVFSIPLFKVRSWSLEHIRILKEIKIYKYFIYDITITYIISIETVINYVKIWRLWYSYFAGKYTRKFASLKCTPNFWKQLIT